MFVVIVERNFNEMWEKGESQQKIIKSFHSATASNY